MGEEVKNHYSGNFVVQLLLSRGVDLAGGILQIVKNVKATYADIIIDFFSG